MNTAIARAEGAIEITLPARRVEPESVVAHLGPTNSGKTYHVMINARSGEVHGERPYSAAKIAAAVVAGALVLAALITLIVLSQH